MSILRSATTVVTALLLVAGCSALTDVESDLVERDDLQNAEGAATLHAGAFGAFNTSVRMSVSEIGLLTDELSITSPIGSDALDARAVTEQQPGSTENTFRGWQNGFGFVDEAVSALRRFAPEPTSRIGELYAIRGYALVFLAENFCSGLPLRSYRDGRPEPGMPHTTAELFELAIAAFDTAAAEAGDSIRLTHWAAVGRGRALLSLGRFADAAAAVAAVPTDFVRELHYSSTFPLTNQISSSFPLRTVSDLEGSNGLPFASAADDPRLELQPAGVNGGVTSLRPAKYATTASPIVLASGIEARLIEAEAALQVNDVAVWLAIHDELRAALDLPSLADPGTPDARVELHFAERAFWLFLTGHRLSDKRRLIRQYGRSPEGLFPTGTYKGGPSQYGEAVLFPVPEAERANPNFTGCSAEV